MFGTRGSAREGSGDVDCDESLLEWTLPASWLFTADSKFITDKLSGSYYPNVAEDHATCHKYLH
jgi:hypothetical protein